ncbi:MAG TPA: protein kinase, partial [Kofleriaceae bacterium]|nr:protein kinase [Kofleriaceae bacterium]
MAVTETLRTVLDAGGASRRLDELSTARVILKIAEQVHAAQHKAGAGKAIGPLTPAGVTIETATGTVRLGLAEPTAYAYAAPEQLGGSEGDRRSDVWSLGVVMWEALTHQPLFEGGDDAAIKAAVKQQIVDPPATLNANIPAELSAICMRALARNPADRYQSAKVMGAELEAVLDDAGYGDSDDKLREYMATLGQPKREPKLSAPPLTVTPAQGMGVREALVPPADMLTPPPGPPSSTSPGVVIPRGDAAPALKSPQAPITVAARATGTTPPGNKAADWAAEIADKTDKTVDKPITDKPSDRISRPSILDQEPAKPPASMVATSAGSLDTKIEGLSPTSFLKSAAPANPGANLAAALASAGTQGAAAPIAKPAPERVGFHTLQSAAAPMPASSITAAPSTV